LPLIVAAVLERLDKGKGNGTASAGAMRSVLARNKKERAGAKK